MSTHHNKAELKVELKRVEPSFEGFVLQMAKPNQKRKAREIVGRLLGAGWQVEGFGDAATDFEVTKSEPTKKAVNRKNALTVGRAWKMTYRLRAEPGVAYAEPMFTVPVNAPPEFRFEGEDMSGEARPRARDEFAARRLPAKTSIFGTRTLPESDDPAWSIREVKVSDAWRRFFAGRVPGAGVVIGHPDTGYSEHPEIVTRLLPKKGYDFVKEDGDPKDDLDSGLLLFPGHGTGTSSVIVSPELAQGDYGSINGKPIAVWGVAPGAKLIPVRVSRSVVLDVPWAGGGVLNLAKAIEHAADKGAHVVSISMGTGFPNTRLLKAVQYAQRRGVIVLAAAGNYVGYVVFPAAYEDVIAVAASNARRQTWKHSSRGSAVDVTAPGESVWCASVQGAGRFVVGRGSGTSFAVATVAGIAALWLAHHGRDTLIARYGVEKIPVIFNQILRDNCDAVPGWDAGFGRGLVNAEKVLSASLPSVNSPLPLATPFLREFPAVSSGGTAIFAHLFENVLRGTQNRGASADAARTSAELQTRLADLLMTSEVALPARLREVGQELAFHFAADPDLYQQFAAALASGKTRRSGSRMATDEASVSLSEDVGAVRASLLAKSTSEALKARLAITLP